MTESIREKLYENSSILLNSLEKTKYLKQWLKEIKQQIFIDILTVPILISLLIIIFIIKYYFILATISLFYDVQNTTIQQIYLLHN